MPFFSFSWRELVLLIKELYDLFINSPIVQDPNWINSFDAKIISLVVSAISMIISFSHIYQHLTFFTMPSIQIYVVRILLTCPVYTITSSIAIFTYPYNEYSEIIRDLYETVVIHSFFNLILEYGGGESDCIYQIEHENPLRLPFPLCFFKKKKKNTKLIRFCYRGILQFLICKPIMTAFHILFLILGINNNKIWIIIQGIIYNISYCWALYCLYVFYLAIKNIIKNFKPIAKFATVKTLIFFTYYQHFFLYFVLIHLEKLNLWNNFLLNIEMIFFAFLFLIAFPKTEFLGGIPSKSFCKNLGMVFNVTDIVNNIYYNFTPAYYDYSLQSNQQEVPAAIEVNAYRIRGNLNPVALEMTERYRGANNRKSIFNVMKNHSRISARIRRDNTNYFFYSEDEDDYGDEDDEEKNEKSKNDLEELNQKNRVAMLTASSSSSISPSSPYSFSSKDYLSIDYHKDIDVDELIIENYLQDNSNLLKSSTPPQGSIKTPSPSKKHNKVDSSSVKNPLFINIKPNTTSNKEDIKSTPLSAPAPIAPPIDLINQEIKSDFFDPLVPADNIISLSSVSINKNPSSLSSPAPPPKKLVPKNSVSTTFLKIIEEKKNAKQKMIEKQLEKKNKQLLESLSENNSLIESSPSSTSETSTSSIPSFITDPSRPIGRITLSKIPKKNYDNDHSKEESVSKKFSSSSSSSKLPLPPPIEKIPPRPSTKIEEPPISSEDFLFESSQDIIFPTQFTQDTHEFTQNIVSVDDFNIETESNEHFLSASPLPTEPQLNDSETLPRNISSEWTDFV